LGTWRGAISRYDGEVGVNAVKTLVRANLVALAGGYNLVHRRVSPERKGGKSRSSVSNGNRQGAPGAISSRNKDLAVVFS